MEIQIMGMIIIFLVIIVVGIAVVTSFTSLTSLLPSQFKNVYNKVVTVIGFKSPYNICDSLAGQKISLQDFQTLLQAVYNGQCGSSHTNVSLSFSLTKSDLEKIATLSGIALDGKLIFYNMSSPLGIGAILVQGDLGQYPLKFEDFVDISASGSPKHDVLIRVTMKGCDPYDDICDAACIFKKICDPVCDDGQRHNIPCNIACIDPDGDGINVNDTQQRVAQGKCNPDCYVNFTNPFKAYDPGCVWKFRNQNDDICDPNSNGVTDGVCDPDCVKTKNICDPDCNGTVYDGNPYGLNDTKCFVCDGTCNGYCSPSCNRNAFPGEHGFDPDCYRQVNSSYFCSGDGFCDQDRGENCENSADCPGGGLTCGDYHAVCCPAASDADVSGCSNTTGIPEGAVCSCGTQCVGNDTCDRTDHCCPQGKIWNGTSCSGGCPARIENPTCDSTSSPWPPQTIRLAYDIEPFIQAGFDGTGQTIAILDAYGDPDIVGDVNTFDQKFGLPPINLNIIGQQTYSGGWEKETALDVEWAHAIAPGATIYLIVEQGSLADGVEYIVNNLPGAIVSMSFADPNEIDRYESLFTQGNEKGITFIAADGDWCAYNGNIGVGPVSYPAGFTNVLAISGTQNLAVTSNCKYVSETAWSCSGGWGTGGNPGDKPEPDYQTAISAITDGKRGYGDVSLVAGDNPTVPIVAGGQWTGVSGTSDASPQWAGIVALLRSAGITKLQGNINPMIYKVGTDPQLSKTAFHDITSGNNGISAQAGWDYPTGFGTPDVVGLCEALQ